MRLPTPKLHFRRGGEFNDYAMPVRTVCRPSKLLKSWVANLFTGFVELSHQDGTMCEQVSLLLFDNLVIFPQVSCLWNMDFRGISMCVCATALPALNAVMTLS